MPRDLEDQDMLMDLLVTHKYLGNQYDHSATEAASEQVRGELLHILEDEHLLQAAVFEMMNRKGYYKIRLAKKPDLEEAYRLASQDRKHI